MPHRIITLVRHGHYDLQTGSLTETGRRQSEITAAYLAGLSVNTIQCSTMTRAQETADIIQRSFPRVALQAYQDLIEIIPAVPEDKAAAAANRLDDLWASLFRRKVPLPTVDEGLVRADIERAALAFERVFQPADSFPAHDIVVCHGTLIRYFTCRVLEVPHRAWTHMGVTNCALTRVLVLDYEEEGVVMILDSFNSAGHLPRGLRT